VTQTVALQLPDETLQRYHRAATIARKALEEFLAERLMEGVPPLAADLPSPLQEEWETPTRRRRKRKDRR
jgi:hypothetical protein